MGRATAWVRRLTWSAVGAGLLAFSCGETPADGRAVPQRITPAELSLVGTGDASHAWRLFDRDVTTGFTPQGFFGHSTVRVSLRRPTHLAFLKVHGPANVSLQAKLDDGSEVTAETDLSTLTPGWHAIPVMTSHAVTALSLHFRQHEPAPGAPEATGAADDGTEGAHTNGGSAVPEVEIWGLGPTPSALSGYVVEQQLESQQPLPDHADDIPAEPSYAFISSTGNADTGTCHAVHFSLPRPATVYRRAWLSYRLSGAFRPFALTRVLNSSPMRRGHWIAQESEPTRIVEPLDTEALRRGDNRYEFCLPSEANGIGVLTDLRFVGELDTGMNAIEAAGIGPADAAPTEPASEVLAPENTTPRTLAAGQRMVLAFERLLSPDVIAIAADTTSFALTCLDVQGNATPLPFKRQSAEALPFALLRVSDFGAPNTLSCAGLGITPTAETRISYVNVLASGAARRIDFPRVTLASPQEHFGRVAWVDGFVQAPSDLAAGPISVRVDAADTGTERGVFGQLIERTGDAETSWPVTVSAALSDGQTVARTFLLDRGGEIDPSSFFGTKTPGLTPEESKKRYGEPGQLKSQTVDGKSASNIELGTHVGVNIPGGAVNGKSTITVKHLGKTELPALDPGMVNVTAPDANAFEFLPHGEKFKKPVELKLPYAPELLPQGYVPSDVNSYYYDTDEKRWRRFARADVDEKSATIKSLTDHFTVTINAIVVAPEHPQSQSFNPNQIRDIQAADPGARVTRIEPPEGTSRGDASLAYPMELPPGRRGLTPELALSYDSGRGNGWVGVGWDMPMRAISIDTRWGAARYHPTQESDTYLFEGEQLAPFFHRDPTKPRNSSGTKEFHTRVEGAFRKIIRHGTTPKTYWWEAVDKSGTRYFYGGGPGTNGPTTDSTLVSDAGDVFLWSLRRIEDRHGNAIVYNCKRVGHAGFANGTHAGSELYLERIDYTTNVTKNEGGAYSVHFKRNSTRPDIMIDGRGGFKRVTAETLKRVEVYFGTLLIRAWNLQYKEGAFHKLLLTGIEERGENDAIFPGNVHTFSYFDEIRENPSDVQSDFKGYEGTTTWTHQNSDDVRADLLVATAIDPSVGEVSLLGGGSSQGSGTHSYIGFSPTNPSKTNSVGYKVGQSNGTTKTKLVFMDVDGDGLPDKVFESAQGYRYRRNLSGPAGSAGFADAPDAIAGLTALGEERVKSRSSGGEAYPGPAQAFLNYGKSYTSSDTYLSDVNGDGLPDLVQKGKVHFNRRNSSLLPEFADDASAGTVLPIQLVAPASGGLLPDLSGDKAEDQKRHPLVDAVRAWVAPLNGTIKLTAPVRLVKASAEPNADGVRVAIQHEQTELWQTTIAKTDTSLKTPSVSKLAVKAGEVIYFRVGSRDDGQDDVVSWDPVIEYDGEPPLLDVNGLDVNKYSASGDFNLAGRTNVNVKVPFKGKVRLKGTLAKTKPTSDNVSFRIKRGMTLEYEQVLAHDFTGTHDVNRVIDVNAGDELFVKLEVDSRIDLNALTYLDLLRLTYDSAEDASGNPIPVKDGGGNPLLSVNMPWDADTYSVALPDPRPRPVKLPITSNDHEIRVTVSSLSQKPFTLTVKRQNELVKKTVVNGQTTLKFSGAKDQLVYVDLSSREDDATLAMSTSVKLEYRVPPLINGFVELKNSHAVFYEAFAAGCSRPYRSFMVAGVNSAALATPDSPIDHATFCDEVVPPSGFDEDTKIPKNETDADNKGTVMRETSKSIALVPFPGGRNCPDPNEPCTLLQAPLWGAADGDVFVSAGLHGPSRLGSSDLSVPSNADLVTGLTVTRLSRSTQTAKGLGAGVGPITGSYSEVDDAESVGLVDYLDLNGDGFPDVVGSAGVQYTRSNGKLITTPGSGLSTARKHVSDSKTIGIGGTASVVIANASGKTSDTPNANGKNAGQETAMPTLGVSLDASTTKGTSDAAYDLMDVNGDGLPDRVVQTPVAILVSLNLGYSFATPEPLALGTAVHGAELREESIGGGLGISGMNDGKFGFGGGFSFNESTTEVSTADVTLMDINGDGLLDAVAPSGATYKVAINTGAGFAPPVHWNNVPPKPASPLGGHHSVTHSVSRNLGGGLYFTIGIGPLCVAGCYVIINPGGDYNRGMNRQEIQVSDINGDGYPDHLYSTDSDEVQVALNKHGRTNLLQGVSRPMGASFTLDYERSGNTYEQPQSRWVLTRVTTHDGFSGDWKNQNPGADYTYSTYSYEDGFYDRSEREFYGYAKVTETEHNTTALTTPPTPSFNAAYRRTTRAYRNDSFFTKGLMTEEIVESGAGARYFHTMQQFQLREVDTGAILTDPATDPTPTRDTVSAVFPELRAVTRRVHEGNAADSIQTTLTHEYDAFGNVTRLVDGGDAGVDDDFVADITYTGTTGSSHAGCKANHIVGLADSITVKSLSGTLLRHRAATFNCNTADLTQLSQTISTGQSATSNFTYDSHGNLASTQGPQNLHQQRYALFFTYDAITKTHVTSVSDSFGYKSEADYDLRWGQVKTETDLNGQVISRSYDPFGRVQQIVGPYQQASGLYTLQFQYAPEAPVPYAVTHHIDTYRSAADPITTILFTDGLGRVLQTKKDGSVHKGKGAPPTDVMIVSGRVTFDHVGRTIDAYYPVTEPKGANNVFNATYDGIQPSTTQYDVIDRVLATTIPDNTTTSHQYTLAADRSTVKRLKTRTTDAESNVKETYRDIRDQIRSIREFNGAQQIWTEYAYDPIQQLTTVKDDQNNLTKVTYDLLGRRTIIDNPDAGKTKMVYDPASNLTQKITANLAQSSKAIFYDYEFNRLKSITYPLFPENNVTYTYGPSNAQGQPGNVVGRITKVTDESGNETRKYGKLGEIVEETRTIASDTQGKSENSPEVWTTSYEYDTWGRLQRMAYPDGELLTYSYDSGGLPHKVTGNKQGVESAYVQKLEYDKFEQRVYLQAGNGVETEFDYDPKDRRLSRLQAGNFQDLHYKYDDVGNILELDNKVPPSPPKDYGGPVTQNFTYDGLYRLTQASGSWRFEPNKSSEYSLTMAYNSIHNITSKKQSHDVVTPGGATVPQKKTSYDVTYSYGAAQPHAPSKIAGSEFLHHGGRDFHYDANGNQVGWDALKSAQKRSIVWDEENRIQSVSDNGRTTTYKYNDAGERVVKRGEQGETAYVNQFFTVRNRSVGTKHVFVGETRLVSKLVPGDAHVNPGNNLFGNTLGQWWWHRSPNGFLHAQNTVKNPHYAGNVMPQKLPEDNFVYFYHPDHVGSTSYVTDYDGALYEHVQYFPFGETWVSEQSNTERLPYLFTSKELDEETALYYFGARYYDPRTSVWQSTDPALVNYLAERGEGGVFAPLNLSPYIYAWHSPLLLIDPDGRQVVPPAPGRPQSVEQQRRWEAERQQRPQDPKWKTAVKWIGAGAAVVVVVAAAVNPRTRQLAMRFKSQAKPVEKLAARGGEKAIQLAKEGAQEGWTQFLPEAAKRLAQAKAKYGTGESVGMAGSRKQSLKHLEGLAPQVEKHLQNIANSPESRDVPGWSKEIRAWLSQMEVHAANVGKKTGAEWKERISRWRAQFGE